MIIIDKIINYNNITDIKCEEAVRNGYDGTLEKIKKYLEEHLAPHYTFKDQTKVAIKFTYEREDVGCFEVDLLLSPDFKNKEAFFRALLLIDDPMKRLM